MSPQIKPFFIVGHRGAPSLVPPGNTLGSLRRAIEVGAQMVEVDVRRTRDDVLVIDHEAVRYYEGQETAICERSLAQWRSKADETTGALDTLEDVFALVRTAGVGLMLDFKEPGTEALLARAVRRSGLPLSHLLVAGADDASRKILRGLDPRIPLSLTLDVEQAARISAKLLAELDTEAVTWNYRLLKPPLVEILHRRGILVYAWTVDLSEDMRRMRDACKVDGIITNCPDLLKNLD